MKPTTIAKWYTVVVILILIIVTGITVKNPVYLAASLVIYVGFFFLTLITDRYLQR